MFVAPQHARSRFKRRPSRIKIVIGLAATVAAIALPASAGANVQSTTGAAELVTAPPSVAIGSYESNTAFRVFEEAQVTTTAIAAPSARPSVAPPATTCFQSHLIHYDGVGRSAPTLTGTVTFGQSIVAIIATNQPIPFLGGALDLTDRLFGAPGTTYSAPGNAKRGIETGGSDSIRYNLSTPLSSSRSASIDGQWRPPAINLATSKTLSFRFGGDGFDEVRVLTGCDAPPPVLPEAPLNVLLPVAGLGVVAVVGLRRRSRRAVAA